MKKIFKVLLIIFGILALLAILGIVYFFTNIHKKTGDVIISSVNKTIRELSYENYSKPGDEVTLVGRFEKETHSGGDATYRFYSGETVGKDTFIINKKPEVEIVENPVCPDNYYKITGKITQEVKGKLPGGMLDVKPPSIDFISYEKINIVCGLNSEIDSACQEKILENKKEILKQINRGLKLPANYDKGNLSKTEYTEEQLANSIKNQDIENHPWPYSHHKIDYKGENYHTYYGLHKFSAGQQLYWGSINCVYNIKNQNVEILETSTSETLVGP